VNASDIANSTNYKVALAESLAGKTVTTANTNAHCR
jgi:hypothetical protein